MLSHYDAVGIVGVALGLYAYARLQWQRDYAKRLSYSLLNTINATLLLYSLSNSWNLAAVISTSMFGLLSLYGVYRCLKYTYRGDEVLKRLADRTRTSAPDPL